VVTGAATVDHAGLHRLEIILVALTASEDKQFTGLVTAVKIKSPQLGLAASAVYRKVTDWFSWLEPAVELDGVYESSAGSSAGGDTTVLGEEVVGVAPTPSVGEQKAPLTALVEIEPGHVSRTDSLVLHLRTLINFLEFWLSVEIR